MTRVRGVFAGLATVDLIYRVTEFPAPNRKIAAGRQQVSAGGPAANAAVAFAHFAGSAELITALGAHPLTQIIRSDLETHRVLIRDATAGCLECPPVSSIFVHEASGDRTVVSANAGAFGGLSYEFDASIVRNADILMVDGHHLPLCRASVDAARDAGIPVVLDGGSWKNGLEVILPGVSVAICSEDFHPPGCENEPAVRQFLFDAGVGQAAITRGAKPVVYDTGRERGEIAVRDIRAVDTLGAGDIFHGAFCWAKVNGAKLPEALQFAGGVAAKSCLHFGTREWLRLVPAGWPGH